MDRRGDNSTDLIMDHRSDHSTDHIMDHSTDHIMDHRSDHSTDDSTDDITDRSDSANSRGSQHQSSRWASDSELERGRGSGGYRALHQDYSQFYRENRSASCPPAPKHRAPSPLCLPGTEAWAGGQRCRTPEQLLTAPLGVLGTDAVRPGDRSHSSRSSTPGSVGMSDTEVSGEKSVFSPPPIQPPGVLLPSVPGGATGGEVEQVDGTTILDPLLGPTQEGEGGKGCETPKPLPKPCLPPLEHASTSSRPKECSGPNPDNEIRERETQLSAPQREEDECGGPVGMNASKPTNAHQGQRSPPASTILALPTQISPATRETALPGRAYRWRWTPEHKLQPELKPESRRVKRHPSPGSDESDIPPFAERMRFFEETSRSRSVSHLPGLVCRAQRPKVHPTNHRRYSDQDTDLYCPPEGGEPSNPEQNCSSSAHKPELGLNVDIQSSKSLCDSSTFCPVAAPGPQDRSQQQQEISSISSTPAEVELRRENEQTQPNRKFSPTQRDQRYTGDLQTAEGALTPDCQSLRDASEAPERLLACSVEVEAEQSQEQAAASSENETGVCERLNRCAAPHRGGIVESNEPPRRKKDPPPRPPPPNWAQFRHRRASCHNLLSSPPSPPPSLSRRESPLHPLPCPEVSRKRSHSFPLRDGGECRLHGPTLTPGPTVPQNPTLMHRVFRPVAPPAEQNPPLRYSTLPFDAMRLTDMRIAPQPHPRFYALKGSPVTRDDRRDALKQQMEAERERRPTSDTQQRLEVPVYSVQYSSEVPVGENGSVLKSHLPEPYFTMTCGPQRRTSSGKPKPETTPTHNAVAAGRGVPLETDIDQFLEEQRVRCLSRPTAVLETDIDSLPEIQASPSAMWSAHGGSLVDLLLEEGSGACRSLLLQHSGEGWEGRESWKSGGSIMGLGSDAVRSSHPTWDPRYSSSSYYSTSSAGDQLLSQARELPGRKEEEEDEELSYKKQQLMERVRRKLGVLREAQRGLQEDVRANARLGEEVEALLQAVCRPSEVDRFRMVTGDLEKVLSLLLSLSCRLLRTEAALEDLSAENHHTRLPLLEKKQQLLAQLTEARELKEHVDGRQRAVCKALGGSLTPEQLRDYSHFLRMKAALLVEQRQLEDRIRLLEEQLRALRESLPSSNSPPSGLGYY